MQTQDEKKEDPKEGELPAQGDMDWFEHLDELRKRLLVSAYAWVVGAIVCYIFSTDILSILKKPLIEILPKEHQNLYFTSIFENFLIHLRVSAYGGVVLAAPVILYQIWLFVSPGLYKKERHLLIPFVLLGSFFFISGTLFAYFFVFPAAFKFLIYFDTSGETLPMITVKEYFGAAVKLLLVFGASFELPVVLVLLGLLGAVESKTLVKNRKWAIMIISIVCAFLSPPDILSMIFMMIPILIFYEGSIIVIRRIEKRESRSSPP